MTRVPVILLLLAAGCRTAPSAVTPMAQKGWMLVQRPYAALPRLSEAGFARVPPQSLALVIEPVFERPATCTHRVMASEAPPDRLRVGETAALRVAIGGTSEHLLDVRTTRDGITLLTPARFTLRPGAEATVRFTATTEGAGGVSLRIIECKDTRYR